MRKVLSGVAAVLCVGGIVWAAGEECDKSKCAVGEKITKLLTSWQAASEAEKSGCPEERAKVQTALASIAKECPIGSRLGETLGYVRTALDVAVKADELCAKACTGDKTAASAEAKECEGAKLHAARGKLIKDLHQLASYAAGPSCDSACGKEMKTVETTAAKPAACEKKISETVASIRADKCEVSAAKTVLASIEGLKCEKKAGEIAAAIRGAGCEKSAGEILAKAATECAAKEGTTVATTAAKPAACEKKIAETVASIRADKCEVSAAKTVLASIEGLKCEKKAGEIAAAVRQAGCEKSAGEILAKAATECCAKEASTVATTAAGEAKDGACCQEIAAKGKTLKASWEKANTELASMCPTKKKELMTTFASLQTRSKTLALMPDTILALAMGMDELQGLNAKLNDMVKANPEAAKGIPADVLKAYEGANAAIAEANDVLKGMSTVMKASAGTCEKAEAKTEA